MLKKVFFSALFLFIQFAITGQDLKKRWVDSVFQTLSTQEKVGQLFMISTSTYLNDNQKDQLAELIKDYHPGGLLITRGGPRSHANLVNKLQKLSPLPMLARMNAAYVLGQSLAIIISFQ